MLMQQRAEVQTMLRQMMANVVARTMKSWCPLIDLAQSHRRGWSMDAGVGESHTLDAQV
jgi:hypothetical protein